MTKFQTPKRLRSSSGRKQSMNEFQQLRQTTIRYLFMLGLNFARHRLFLSHKVNLRKYENIQQNFFQTMSSMISLVALQDRSPSFSTIYKTSSYVAVLHFTPSLKQLNGTGAQVKCKTPNKGDPKIS